MMKALLALLFSAGAGFTWCMPLALSSMLSYGLMVLAQTQGVSIIGLIHNASAAKAASQPDANSDVLHDASVAELCAGYEAHHWESTSNCLHASGMLLVFVFALACCMGNLTSHWKLRLAVSIPPTWYLYAWAGHYAFQADIPAVFTYGMSLRGWAVGELCSVGALLAGRTVGPRGPNGSMGIEEWALTAALILVYAAAAAPAWTSLIANRPDEPRVKHQ